MRLGYDLCEVVSEDIVGLLKSFKENHITVFQLTKVDDCTYRFYLPIYQRIMVRKYHLTIIKSVGILYYLILIFYRKLSIVGVVSFAVTVILCNQFILLKSMRINYGMLIVICGAAGSYVFYTYLTPILQQYIQIPISMTSLVLSLFGISTIISNLLSGRIASLGGMKKMPIVYFLQALCLLALIFTSYHLVLGLINILLMGVIMYLQNSPAQLHFLKTATREKPEAITLASALNPVSFNTGIALGSACGGIIINFAPMPFVGLGGAIFAIIAMIINLRLLKNMTKFNKRG